MTTFYAQSYSFCAGGFYFEDAETYEAKIGSTYDDYGELIEEFEIQFIDGDRIDCELCKAIGLYQSNILAIIEKLDEWNDDEKAILIIAVGECGYDFDIEIASPHDFDVDFYEVDNLKELAYQFVKDGLFGDIPDNISHYLDYDAIARDLGMDYSELTINGKGYVYTCR